MSFILGHDSRMHQIRQRVLFSTTMLHLYGFYGVMMKMRSFGFSRIQWTQQRLIQFPESCRGGGISFGNTTAAVWRQIIKRQLRLKFGYTTCFYCNLCTHVWISCFQLEWGIWQVIMMSLTTSCLLHTSDTGAPTCHIPKLLCGWVLIVLCDFPGIQAVEKEQFILVLSLVTMERIHGRSSSQAALLWCKTRQSKRSLVLSAVG